MCIRDRYRGPSVFPTPSATEKAYTSSNRLSFNRSARIWARSYCCLLYTSGPATVTVTSGDGTVSAATVQILTVAPGLFSANENGQGVAAAVAVEGQSASLVYSCGSAPGSCAAVPIGLNQTVLELYGTGIRGHSASGVTCTVGGVSVPVLYAGAQGQYSGLDQVNVSLPPTIANRSQLSIVLTVDGQNSNAVTVSTGAAAGN